MRISSVRSLVCPTSDVQHGRGRIAVVALGLAIAAVHAAAFPSASSAAYPPSAEGRTVAAASDHSDATRAALDVMAAGGTAADGAVAAALVLGVVNPTASGIGGGGFALVYSAADRKVSVIDFRETAPASYSADVLTPPKKPTDPKPIDRFGWTGPRGGAVGVPGEPAGLELLSRRFGKRSLADDAAPAVALAQNGFYVSKHTAETAALFKGRVQTIPSLASAFLPGGAPAAPAARIRRPDLAATIQRFGAEGKKSIYEGATAQKIVDSVHAVGGTLTREDLAGYSVKERAPLSRTIDGRTVYTMPAPSAGGLMLLETLSMYGASRSSPLVPLGFGSSAYLHTVAEVMRGAFADRARSAGDPDLDPNVDKAFAAALEPAQIAARRARIDPTKTHAPTDFKTKEQGTSHVVVADAAGNVVTLTTTVNGPFGASIVAGDTGIVLNNELDDFTSLEDAKAFGLKDGGPNRPRPRARPVSSMTPTIVVEGGVPILALGGSGGTRIATGTTQATLARLLFDLDPNACVSHPRIHTQGPTLFVDPDIVLDVRDGLRSRGETVKDEPFTGSAIQMIAWTRTPNAPVKILAAADPRKGGMAAAR
jgi:gamma-glutamyltranspeptidase/glutathione hydrolase